VKPKKATKLECTAYHEAGHAVAAIALGRGVRLVTIVPDREAGLLGNCICDSLPGLAADPHNPNARGRRALVEQEIMICYAGSVAQDHCRSGYRHISAEDDHIQAVLLAESVLGNILRVEIRRGGAQCLLQGGE
jgi:hypothetical protein